MTSLSSFNGRRGRNQLMTSLCAFAHPELSRADFQPDRAGYGTACFFTVDQNARLPKNLARTQLIALADVENAIVIDHLGAANQSDDQPLFIRPMLESTVEQEGYAGVCKHVRIVLSARRVKVRFRQHQ